MFSHNLTELRKNKKITQAEMADILGVARTTYSSYEQGRRTPDAEIQKKIADFFKVSLDFLHGRPESKIDKSEMSKEQLTVAAHIDDDVTEEEMEDILNYIEFIKNKHRK
mgnify:CR=1 FL=1